LFSVFLQTHKLSSVSFPFFNSGIFVVPELLLRWQKLELNNSKRGGERMLAALSLVSHLRREVTLMALGYRGGAKFKDTNCSLVENVESF
jgi:hypothetical protein